MTVIRVSDYVSSITNGNWGGAVNAALNAASVAKERQVIWDKGTYTASGIQLLSHLELVGDGCTVYHPNGTDGVALISTPMTPTTGTIAANSKQLTVANANGFEIGQRVVVYGAGAMGDVPLHHYATVVCIAGLIITLDLPAVTAVTNAVVFRGIVDSCLSGITFDGHKAESAAGGVANGLMCESAHHIKVHGCTFRNFGVSAVMSRYGSYDVNLYGCKFSDNGYPATITGASVWGHQGGQISVRACTFDNDYIAVALDDRSSSSVGWNAQVIDSLVRNNTIHNATIGILLNGVRDSSVSNNIIKAKRGIVAYGSSQGAAAIPVTNCVFDKNTIQDADKAIEIGVSTSLVWLPTNNIYQNCTIQLEDTSPGNPVNVTPDASNIVSYGGQNYKRIDNGSQVMFKAVA